jgi:hypothetical protein
MPRSTTSAGTERPRRRLIALALGLALLVELVTAAALLDRPVSRPASDGTSLSARVSAEMPGAVDAVSAFWGDAWPRDHVAVVITDSDTEFAAQTGEPNRDWTGVAAVAVADRVDLSRREASGQRIVFAPGANSMSQNALRIVLRHELFHYAARVDTAFDAPRWLVEGVADYVARPPAPRPGPGTIAALPSDAELDAEGASGSAAYDRAWWFARFVADRYGPPALRRLYVTACGPTHPDADAAVHSALGTSLPELLIGWQHWLAG